MAKSPLDTVGFRTWGGGAMFLNATDKKCADGGGGHLFRKSYKKQGFLKS